LLRKIFNSGPWLIGSLGNHCFLLRVSLSTVGLLRAVLILAGSVFLLISASALSDEPLSEASLSDQDRLKAQYLIDFTRFIEWPEYSSRDKRTEITICMQADAHVFDTASALAKQRTVGAEKLRLQLLALQNNTRCDVAYFEKAQESLPQNLQEVLIVAANTGIYPEVAAIAFYQDEKRLSFAVNMTEINRLELSVSSELLKLARIK
jgi:hypothetical protein